jgi:hypothetical protein
MMMREGRINRGEIQWWQMSIHYFSTKYSIRYSWFQYRRAFRNENVAISWKHLFFFTPSFALICPRTHLGSPCPLPPSPLSISSRAQRNDADARLAAALSEQRTMRERLAAADAAVLEFKAKFDALAAVLPPGMLQ